MLKRIAAIAGLCTLLSATTPSTFRATPEEKRADEIAEFQRQLDISESIHDIEITGITFDPKHEFESETVAYLINALEREEGTRPLRARIFNIIPAKPDSTTRIVPLDWEKVGGMYTGNIIHLRNTSGPVTIHHEIGHDKHESDFGLWSEWRERFAYDEDRNYLYQSCRSPRSSEKCDLMEPAEQLEEDNKLGFVTIYARSGYREDVAEVQERAFNAPGAFKRWLFDPKYQKIKERTEVLIGRNYIHPELIDYASLDRIAPDSTSSYQEYQTFFTESSRFLEHFPNSIYTANVHIQRAYAYDDQGLPALATREYLAALASPKIRIDQFQSVLDNLVVRQDDLGNWERAHAIWLVLDDSRQRLKKFYDPRTLMDWALADLVQEGLEIPGDINLSVH